MPELPEVETLRLQLKPLLTGLVTKEVEVLKRKSFVGDAKLLQGTQITGVSRFGKMLVFDIGKSSVLAIHLKLTGQLIYRGKKEPPGINVTDPLLKKLPNKHTRVILTFANGDHLYFNDLRIFGWMKLVDKKNLENLTAHLGPEPLKDLTLKEFARILGLAKKPVKVMLLDQEKLSGVGNIYANDALFLARINPATPANSIPREKTKLLYEKLLKVLRDGIKWGGASENNFRDAFGQMGKVQEHFYVYGRKGKKCLNSCGEVIKRVSLGGRGTFFCPKCQGI